MLNQDRMSSTFHIVEKNGEIELVHLDRVNISSKINSKKNPGNQIERIPTEKCTCVMCQPVLERNVATNISQIRPMETRGVKNYLKVKRKPTSRPELSTNLGTNGILLSPINDKTNVENNGIVIGNDASDTMISIKPEPELEIMDVDMTSNQSERDIEDEISTTRMVIKDANAHSNDNEVAKLESDVKIRKLQFQTKEIKCNICKMVFPANIQQEPAMKTHFMLHKNSVKTRFDCGICHKKLLDMDYLMIIQHKRSHEKNKNLSSDHRAYAVTGDKLLRSGSIGLEEIHNTTLLYSRAKLQHGTKAYVRKSTRNSTRCYEVDSFNDEGADSDDDVQIIEKKPELIVIDDNDENFMVKKAQKNL